MRGAVEARGRIGHHVLAIAQDGDAVGQDQRLLHRMAR